MGSCGWCAIFRLVFLVFDFRGTGAGDSGGRNWTALLSRWVCCGGCSRTLRGSLGNLLLRSRACVSEGAQRFLGDENSFFFSFLWS